MRECTVYCLPSHGEPFGVSALEAMSCGRPIVATEAGGLQYLVDATGGRKVPVGDSNRLAEALLEIIRFPKLADAMGNHNRLRAVREYDWNVVVDQLERIYEDAIATRHRIGRRSRSGRSALIWSR
jgi:glycosyltransferase involved in cell wall biosynthesis